jgi:hypothetical protein
LSSPISSTRVPYTVVCPCLPAPVEVHAYDRRSKDFTVTTRARSKELLRDLKVQEAIYSKLIDCLS